MKSGTEFRFKQFTVAHDRSTHKVGTDGVLLGAWVNVAGVRRILDIGTGTGLIALMLAQRTQPGVTIDAVEIGAEDAAQARANVKASPWPDRVHVHHTGIQKYQTEKKYDLLVSNPPFFTGSLLPPEEKRRRARHTHELPFDELLEASIRLMADPARLAVVLPYAEGLAFTDAARARQLHLTRVCEFRSRTDKPVERLLMEFGKNTEKVTKEELILYSAGDTWSDRYRALTRAFYLKG